MIAAMNGRSPEWVSELLLSLAILSGLAYAWFGHQIKKGGK